MRVVIHIDTVVIEGLDQLDMAQFQRALEASVLQHLETQGMPEAWQTSAWVPTLSTTLSPGAVDASGAAAQVAQLLTGGGPS